MIKIKNIKPTNTIKKPIKNKKFNIKNKICKNKKIMTLLKNDLFKR